MRPDPRPFLFAGFPAVIDAKNNRKCYGARCGNPRRPTEAMPKAQDPSLFGVGWVSDPRGGLDQSTAPLDQTRKVGYCSVMSQIEDIVRKNFIRFLVQRAIFCPINDNYVLDMDTCVVILDRDGDPTMVMSPEGWDELAALVDGDESRVLAEGYSRMER